jgi:hypothetical protein
VEAALLFQVRTQEHSSSVWVGLLSNQAKLCLAFRGLAFGN